MVKIIDGMSISDAITLYYEKHYSLQQGDIKKLSELKNKYPEIFDKEKDKEIRDLIDYYKKFQVTDRYKELCKMKLKESLLVIQDEEKK